MQKIMIER